MCQAIKIKIPYLKIKAGDPVLRKFPDNLGLLFPIHKTSVLFPIHENRDNYQGRSSDFRIILLGMDSMLTAPSHLKKTVTMCGFRPRLQRRARS